MTHECDHIPRLCCDESMHCQHNRHYTVRQFHPYDLEVLHAHVCYGYSILAIILPYPLGLLCHAILRQYTPMCVHVRQGQAYQCGNMPATATPPAQTHKQLCPPIHSCVAPTPLYVASLCLTCRAVVLWAAACQQLSHCPPLPKLQQWLSACHLQCWLLAVCTLRKPLDWHIWAASRHLDRV
jgi:hypothetical protein